MANPLDFLNLYADAGAVNGYPSEDSFEFDTSVPAPLGWMPSAPVELNGGIDLPMGQPEVAVPQNFSQKIQEFLGARQPDSGGMAADILSSRFNTGTSYGDYASGIVQSALGKPTLGTDVGQSRMKQQLEQMQMLQNIDTLGARADLYRKGGTGTNGATMQIINGLMTEAASRGEPMTFEQALYKYQAGNRQGSQLTPQRTIELIPGALPTQQQMEGGKKLSESIAGEAGKALIDLKNKATDATMSLESNKQARELLNSGIVTGTGADFITGFGNLLSSRLGYGDATDPVANTQAYVATTAGEVGRVITAFGSGTGLSDADREYAAKIAGGQISLNEQSIRKILDIRDKQNKWILQRYNIEYGRVPEAAKPYDLSVPQPNGSVSPDATPPAGKTVNWIRQNGKLVPAP